MPGALKILVTGFGAFPGAPKNPTTRLMEKLAAYVPALARQGIHLDRRVLPVVFANMDIRLAALAAELAPDAILHFGVAGRRKWLSVETRAVNRLTPLHFDAARKRALIPRVRAGGPLILRATLPVATIDAALRHAGISSYLSQDAGDYVCNQSLFLSLATPHAPLVGFIHVPRLPRTNRRGNAVQCITLAMHVQAALIAIRLTARTARRGF